MIISNRNKSNIKRCMFIIISFFVLTGCKKDCPVDQKNCAYNQKAPAREMFAPNSVQVDSIIKIAVVYNNQRLCQNFNGFTESISGNTRTIGILTTIDTCNCQSQLNIQTKYYSFVANTSGQQIINLYVTDSLSFIDTVVVY